jgi:hypothetical protein
MREDIARAVPGKGGLKSLGKIRAGWRKRGGEGWRRGGDVATPQGATDLLTRAVSRRSHRGLMLPMIKGSLPDFGPIFDRYAADLKRACEG